MEMPALLPESDFVVAWSSRTSREKPELAAFAAMKPRVFINAARQLVDDDALPRALDAGRLAGCALTSGGLTRCRCRRSRAIRR
jgi:D-3-phosphoglycerate dehydrogenase